MRGHGGQYRGRDHRPRQSIGGDGDERSPGRHPGAGFQLGRARPLRRADARRHGRRRDQDRAPGRRCDAPRPPVPQSGNGRDLPQPQSQQEEPGDRPQARSGARGGDAAGRKGGRGAAFDSPRSGGAAWPGLRLAGGDQPAPDPLCGARLLVRPLCGPARPRRRHPGGKRRRPHAGRRRAAAFRQHHSR